MIYVTLTDAEGRLAGRITLWNDGTGTPEKGNYVCKIIRKSGDFIQVNIEGFDRVNNDAIDLLREALNAGGVRSVRIEEEKQDG
ncbi:MAG: hypothetical protein WC455_11705 [Dehalococcoidia bacterium]|jgi:hypothetical protein